MPRCGGTQSTFLSKHGSLLPDCIGAPEDEAMPKENAVVGWEEVRDQELSEIITRRTEAGLLPPEALAELVQHWAHRGLLPPEAPGELLLRLLEAGLLSP